MCVVNDVFWLCEKKKKEQKDIDQDKQTNRHENTVAPVNIENPGRKTEGNIFYHKTTEEEEEEEFRRMFEFTEIQRNHPRRIEGPSS